MTNRHSALVVHGGAWSIPDDEVDDHLQGLSTALQSGWSLLVQGASSLDVVEHVVSCLEDNPTFDAGKGSVLNTDGSVEMDASIIEARTLRAGAVAALRNFANPVQIARRVLCETEHILLAGEGCAVFAEMQGFHPVPIENLLTQRELQRLAALKQDGQFRTPHAFGKKRGTVGAVALDQPGDIAAATSTGGTPKKIPGRVGDSALIGSGTWAENRVGGVSCTGWGESIMQVMLAREVAEGLRSTNSPQVAAGAAIKKLQDKVRGLGGVICLSAAGDIGVAFNTPRMARGFMRTDMDAPKVEIQ